ncbi:MAG: superoxide dismutase [Acidobacteriota bacterium]
MKKISRRESIGNLLSAGAGMAILGNHTESKAASGNSEPTTTQATTLAFRGQHPIKPLPFDPTKLKGISEKLIKSHWENNYSGAVKALNAVEQRLDALLKDKDLPPYIYGDVKREELVRTGSVVLHEHYFGNLGGDGKAGGAVVNLIKNHFGSFENWEAEFRKTAMALSGGSGWAVLSYNLHNGELHNYWAWDHMHNAPMGRPLLVLDMYEHAYHMDYGAAAAKYVDAFMMNVNWQEVNRRAEQAIKIPLI